MNIHLQRLYAETYEQTKQASSAAEKYETIMRKAQVKEAALHRYATPDGLGIMRALKGRLTVDPADIKAMPVQDRKKIEKLMKFLQKPPYYGKDYKSYFTDAGDAKFQHEVLPLLATIANLEGLSKETVETDEEPYYSEEMQQVFKSAPKFTARKVQQLDQPALSAQGYNLLDQLGIAPLNSRKT